MQEIERREVCPYCGSCKTKKNGFGRKGQRRYLCSRCNRTFMGPEDRLKLYNRKLRREIRQKLREYEYEHWFCCPEELAV